MNINKIYNDLGDYNVKIIKELSKNNWKFFNYYFNINEDYRKNNISNEFKNNFCNFYRLNGPRGLNNLQKLEFFNLLEKKENNIEIILSNLYKIPGFNNRNKFELSFSSKLLHTLDNNLAIYDKNISEILSLSKQISSDNFKEKLKNRIDIYKELQDNFKLLLNNEDIAYYLKNIRQELKNKAKLEDFKWRDDLMTNAKLLDFSLWALYIVKKGI